MIHVACDAMLGTVDLSTLDAGIIFLPEEPLAVKTPREANHKKVT
jgi:hypothetical protein